jgi:Cro/C1-type HTH DNA-binding domain
MPKAIMANGRSKNRQESRWQSARPQTVIRRTDAAGATPRGFLALRRTIMKTEFCGTDTCLIHKYRYNYIMTKKFRDQLVDAIERSGMTRYAIAKATGLPQSQLSRFVHGQEGLSVDSIDQICELLGLRLIGSKKTRIKKGK